ncbi:hypothetical protein DDE83_001505 [Stemphylium lycopersici]|uniref:Chitin-binding type-1 domain-containing protein n=1 Tax=Stemphylium lycopersici TaxID=183478 RepID=A0A364NCL5_STELY|nr:hypothetical protein DDE83_001505 [Stemphylium lycopersici]
MRLNLALLLGVVTLASATNTIKFINHCSYDIWFWTVGPAESKILGADQDRNMVPGNGGSVIHNMIDTEKAGGGISLKMRDYPYYQVAPAGIIQVEYHFQPSVSAIWPEGHCPPAYCSKTECWNTYMQQGGFKDEPSFKCLAGSDIFVETCTENSGQQTFYGQGPNSPRLISPPAPVMISDPVPEQPAPPPSLPSSLPPAPPPSQNFLASPNGECGAEKGYTCSGSVHGMCCSQWGFCGNTLDHCLPSCNRAFGHCLLEDGGNNSTDISGTSPVVTTATTATATVTESITHTHTSTKMQPGPIKTATVTRTHMLTKTHVRTSASFTKTLERTVYQPCPAKPFEVAVRKPCQTSSTGVLGATPATTTPPTITSTRFLTKTEFKTRASITKTLELTVYPAWCPAKALEEAPRTATMSLDHTVYEPYCPSSTTGVEVAALAITAPPTVTETRVLIKTHLRTVASVTKTLERTVYQSCRPRLFEG